MGFDGANNFFVDRWRRERASALARCETHRRATVDPREDQTSPAPVRLVPRESAKSGNSEMEIIHWVREEPGRDIAVTDDGYTAAVFKMNRTVDAYFGAVDAPAWSYTGLFATRDKAKAWCRKIVARDRRAPLKREKEI